MTSEEKQELVKPANLNAFDSISLSAGFDLSSLFEEPCLKKGEIYIPATCQSYHFEARGNYEASADEEIFEVSPLFHLVEVKKSNGDTLEYQKILNEGIRPALQDIVWAWKGDHHWQQSQLELQPLSLQLQEQLP
ncbi:CBL-interacting protein kinase 18 [Camellia lanceoleosa]|uniref:CBL-interacting protein kinase 18 n=1 Tax=Camellia lanceoleosa TaxID=1840588 RepID=A0ACC0HL16_9ERIC|nr:CBL-interacting protein kinase 18 [Camellia lanceoleosa]